MQTRLDVLLRLLMLEPKMEARLSLLRLSLIVRWKGQYDYA